jgi:TIR domain
MSVQASQPPPSRSTAFISYSRRDAEFAEHLLAGLKSLGVDAYLDRKDIAPGEAWRDRLGKLIAASDAVVFVLSPDSASSDICRWEAEQAHELGKRLLPVIRRDLVDQKAPELLAARNYIFSRSDSEFADALAMLAEAIARDIDLVREQTRLSQLAHDWAAKGRSTFGLLRGDTLIAAERWQGDATRLRVSVGTALATFIERSRQQFDADETARVRLITEALRVQSDQLATLSDQALQNNDPLTALYLAVASAPDMRSRLEETRTRPLTPRSVAALSNARRHVTAFEFLDPGDRAGLETLHAAPDGAFLCGAVQNVVKLFAGSAPFRMLGQREFSDAVLDICFSGNSKRVAVLLDRGSADVLDLPGLTLRYGHAWPDAKTVVLAWHGRALCAEGNEQLHAVLEEGGTVSLDGGRTPSDRHDGSLLGALRHETAIWSSQAARLQPLGDAESICLGFDPHANVWIAGHGQRASVRSVDPDRELFVLPLAPDRQPVAATFSADGKTFVLEEQSAQRICWTIWSIAGDLHTEIASTQPSAPPPIRTFR